VRVTQLAGRSSRHRPSRGEEFFFFSRSINSSAFDCQGIPSLFEYLWIFGLAQVKISDMAALDSKCRFHPPRELRGELGIEPNNHAASMGWLSRCLAKRRHQRGRFITVLLNGARVERSACSKEFDVSAKTSNLGEPPTRFMYAWRLTTLLFKPSSCQRANDGIESLTGIVWFELYLQATLSAIQEYTWLAHRYSVDSNRNTFLLCEGTDSANMIAGQPFGVGGTHHLCSLAVECGSQLFHANFAIRRDDDADRLAVDLGHKRLQDAPRLYTDGLSSLKADAFGIGIVVVTMECEVYTNLVQRKGRACAL
jgi:hypothetical protein